MSKFDPIELGWGGERYTIAPERIMGAIAVIEDHLTQVELYEALANKRPPLSKISAAYAAVINYAARDKVASSEQVYFGMFGKDGMSPDRGIIELSVATLLAMMMPPQHLRSKEKSDAKVGKEMAAAKVLKQPSKSRSAPKAGTSRRGTSGRSIQ